MAARDQAKQKVKKLENQDRSTENSEGRGQSTADRSQEVEPKAKELTVHKAVVQVRRQGGGQAVRPYQ